MQKLLLMVVFSFSISSDARWMLPSEANISILEKTLKIHVNKDGSSIVFSTQKIKILNEKGRLDWGTWRLNYTPKNSKLLVTSAKTTNGKNVDEIDQSNIVDTPINATESGFDEFRQIVIPFSQVQVGSIIEISMKQETFRPFLKGQYSDRIFFGDSYLLEKSTLDIESERPLYFELNDPLAALALTKNESPKKNQFQYKIKQRKPIIRGIFEENEAILSDEKLEWVAISSAKSYNEMFKPLAARYEEILAQDLPKKLTVITELAKNVKEPIEQINVVLSSLADRVRYMGDWRSIDGAFVPRDLKTISATRFGDCKDLAALTVKILRQLGLKADVAFINRGSLPYTLPKVAYLGFNHAVATVDLNGRRLWLDATNFQSFADGVFEDIGERQALILSAEPYLEKVEFTSPENNIERWAWDFKLRPGEIREDKVNLFLSGSQAIRSTGSELSYSKKRFESETVANLANMSEVLNYEFSPYDLKSRVVKPIQLSVAIKRHYQPLETSLGPAIGIEPLGNLEEIIKVDSQHRVSDMQLEPPNISEFIVNFKNFKAKGDAIKDCKAESMWLDYYFSYSRENEFVSRKLVTKKYLIHAEEIKSAKFKIFQNDLRKCIRGRYFIIDNKS